ncbi:TIGR03936 family radical SAM-associated protein [Pseudothermotoga sp.]
MRAVVRYKKTGLVRFLSAIETANAIERNFRRAEASLEFSQGFHKKPKVSFLDSTPTGVFNLALYVTVHLHKHDENLLHRLKRNALEGLEPVQLWWTDLDVNRIVSGYLFRVILPSDCIDPERFDSQSQVFIPEKKRSGKLEDFFKHVHFEKVGKFFIVVYYQNRENLVKAKHLYQPILVKECPLVLVQRIEAICGETGLSEVLGAKSWAVEF